MEGTGLLRQWLEGHRWLLMGMDLLLENSCVTWNSWPGKMAASCLFEGEGKGRQRSPETGPREPLWEAHVTSGGCWFWAFQKTGLQFQNSLNGLGWISHTALLSLHGHSCHNFSADFSCCSLIIPANDVPNTGMSTEMFLYCLNLRYLIVPIFLFASLLGVPCAWSVMSDNTSNSLRRIA